MACDGYLVVGVQMPESLAEIEASGISYVCINTQVGEKGYACQVNDVLGIRKAMDYLQQMGHRRIAYRNKYARIQVQRMQDITPEGRANYDLDAECAKIGSETIRNRLADFLEEIKLPLLCNHDSMIINTKEFLK